MAAAGTHVAMLETCTNRTRLSGYKLGNLVNLVHIRALVRQCTRNLVYENGARQTTSTNERPLLSSHGDIVSDDRHSDGMARVHGRSLFLCETKEEDISGISLDDEKCSRCEQ